MNPAIEKIISSDEAAMATVERAERDAVLLIADAKEEARGMLAAFDEQIRETEQRDIVPIVADGQQQAQEILEQAEQYVERLRKKLSLKKTKIAVAFVSNVVKMGRK